MGVWDWNDQDRAFAQQALKEKEQMVREQIAREIENYDYQFMSQHPLAYSDPMFVAKDMRGIAAHIARNGIAKANLTESLPE